MGWNIFRRRHSTFNSLEVRIIEEVKRHLSQEARELLDGQLREINLIQRPAKREANCYNIKRGKATRDPRYRFPNETKELKFATVKFRSAENLQYTADLYLVRGYFFSIVFSWDQTAVRNKGAEIEILVVQIHQDVMMKVSEQPEQAPFRASLSGWLREWEAKYTLRKRIPPVNKSERQRFLETIPVRFPSDYLEMTEQLDGFIIDNCRVFGLSKLYGIVMSDADYNVLAELEGVGVIAVKANTDDSLLYFLDFDENKPQSLGTSFRKAVEDAISRYSHETRI